MRKTPSAASSIMIVEDQPDLAFTYNTLLIQEGWNVKSFTNSEDALRHYEEHIPSSV